MANFCVICGIPLMLSGPSGTAPGVPVRKRCGYCAGLFRAALERLRAEFRMAFADGIVTPDEWQGLLERFRAARGVSPTNWREEALVALAADAQNFLSRLMSMAYADGLISASEDTYFRSIVPALLIDQAQVKAFFSRWSELKRFSRVRQGHLPVIQTALHLDAGELCHFQEKAQYAKTTTKGIVMVPGQLVATSKRAHFLATDASGWTIQYDKVMGVTPQSGTLGKGALTLALSVKKGAGTYHVSNLEWAEVVFSTIIRIHKRQLVVGSGGPSRHIPQDVKNAVWQRDAGRCVQCQAADYFEYDHVIPHSKGGASTFGNVQLLCRRCNNGKADRI